MEKGVIFTMEDVKRYAVIEALLNKKMTNKDAAMALGLTKRQIQRIKDKVKKYGPAGVIHGNRGCPSLRSFPQDFKDRVISLARTKYFDFNFTHLSEKLEEEESLTINRETLRQWLRPLGFGGKIKKQPRHRKRRKRSEKEGYMLFLDGSPHRWFGEEKSALILSTDDATGKPLSLSLDCFKKKKTLTDAFLCVRRCLINADFLYVFISIEHLTLLPPDMGAYMYLRAIKNPRSLKGQWGSLL